MLKIVISMKLPFMNKGKYIKNDRLSKTLETIYFAIVENQGFYDLIEMITVLTKIGHFTLIYVEFTLFWAPNAQKWPFLPKPPILDKYPPKSPFLTKQPQNPDFALFSV